MHQRRIISKLIVLTLLAATLFFGCTSKPTAGQLIMDVTGESFPVVKMSSFNKNHDFWVFQIRDASITGKQKASVSLKGAGVDFYTKGLGFTMLDPAGYEWNVLSLAEMEKSHLSGQAKKNSNIVGYSFAGRMEEKNTMVAVRINADYRPLEPGFDGSLRGEITNEKNEVLYTFESNARLDTFDKPDDGFQVFSIEKDGNVVAVLDSRNGYEVTFFEGLVPTQRTVLGSTISSLFMLMKYGAF